MYSKYGEISVIVKNLRTCNICYERPIFFSDADLRIHERNFHHSYQEGRHEDLKAIRSQLPILTNLLSRQINPDQRSFYNSIEENSKFTETEILSLKRRMVVLENEINDLKKSCTGKCFLSSTESMCSSCTRFESQQLDREEEKTLDGVDGQTLEIGMLQKELANTTREARQLQEEKSKDKQKLRKIKALLNAQQQKIKELEKVKDAQKKKIETKNKFKTAKQKFNRIKREENPFSHVADDDGKDKLKFERTEDKRETFLTQQRDNTSSFPAVRNEKEECSLDSSPTQKSDTLKNEIGIITKNEKVPNKDLGEFVEKLENKTRNEELENKEEIELPQETISFSNTVQSYKTTTVVRPAKSQEKERAVKLSQKEKELRGNRKSIKSHDKQLKEPLSATLMLKEEKQHLFNHVIQMENEKKSLFESKANLQLKFDELNDKYNKEVKKASKHEEDLKRLKEVEQELCEVKQEKKLVEGREKELLKELSQLTNNMKQQRERFELRLKAVNIKVEDLEKELASRNGKFKNAKKEIYSLTLEDQNMLNEADQAQKFNKGFTLKQLSQDLQEERQMVKNVENKNKGCMKTIKELETKLLAKNECLDVANKRIEELSADLKQIKMVFKKEHKEAKKVASIEADKSEDNVSNCSKQLIEIRKNLNEARKKMSKGQTSYKKNVAEDTVTDLGLLNKDNTDNTEIKDLLKSTEDGCFTLLPTPLPHQCGKLAALSPSGSIVNQIETKVEEKNTILTLTGNEAKSPNVEIKFSPYQKTEPELDITKKITSFLTERLTEMRKDVDKVQTDLSEEQPDCQSADNSEKDKTNITGLKDMKSFNDISYFTLLPKSPQPYNKLVPLPTLNYSSVFDLPPFHTAGSSSILMDKDSAIQECQPLDDSNNHDCVSFDGDDIDKLLAGEDDLETERASKQQKQFFQRT